MDVFAVGAASDDHIRELLTFVESIRVSAMQMRTACSGGPLDHLLGQPGLESIHWCLHLCQGATPFFNMGNG